MFAMAAIYRVVLELCGRLTGLSIGIIAVLVSVDVLIRNLGFAPLSWLLESVEYTLYATTFLAAPWVLSKGAHVRVDLIIVLLPPKFRYGLELLVDGLGATISLILFYYSLGEAIDSYAHDRLIYKTLTVTEWWFLAIIPFSSALLAIGFVLRILRTVSHGIGAVEGTRIPDGF